jgi:hypothetical protein
MKHPLSATLRLPVLRSSFLLGLALIDVGIPAHLYAHGCGSRPQSSPRWELAKAASKNSGPIPELPRLPQGVTELKFSDFFVNPVGSRGLEMTGKLRSLDGRRVRILGYMAHREVQPPGLFLLAPYPLQVHDHDNSLAEDFPVGVMTVYVPTLQGQPVPHATGLMLLTGVVKLGNQEEADGRMSLVRLELDPPEKFGRTRLVARALAKGSEALCPLQRTR